MFDSTCLCVDMLLSEERRDRNIRSVRLVQDHGWDVDLKLVWR
jgi:hypothetical protein